MNTQQVQQLRTEEGRQYLQIGLPLDLNKIIVKEAARLKMSKNLLIVETLRRGLEAEKQAGNTA